MDQQLWPAASVELRPIDRLTPYARNARTHSDEQVAQVAASIPVEEWRGIPGFDYYEASNFGRIRSAERVCPLRSRAGYMTKRRYRERVLKGCLGKNGYLTVQLPKPDGAGWVHFCVNRLVFSAFKRVPRDDEEIDHRNRVRSDNSIDNLRPLSLADNRALRVFQRGVQHHAAKLSEEQALAIMASSGTQMAIARDFNVSRSLIGQIKSHKVWTHIS